ncbi:hypothetical protein HX799_13220 [Pseudomonas tolaasii]|nr:hypothetical protein [Pseudomonas tolaasii]NWC30566.1 hypothetical protein [Pseudomonas tolaasii]NWC52123.1 hypothetical protein [Pseudomonas tolaasii]NWE64317.1 hypothetical protein [Pseudomonas tolaasii]
MVELESMHPWYFVTIQLIEGTKRRSKKFMPTDAALLSDLLDLQNSTFLIDDVQVVTAPSVNRSSSERMEKLISLVVGYDQRGECVLLHEVASGVVYSSTRDDLDAGSLTGIRTIYEDTKTAPSAVQEWAEH